MTSKEQEKGKCEYCKNHGHNFCPAPPKREEEKVGVIKATCPHCGRFLNDERFDMPPNILKTCLSINCPERTGGECNAEPPKEEQPRESEKEEWGGWKIVSDMLDHPYKDGLYPTSKCYKELYDFVIDQKEKARREVVDTILKMAEGTKKEHRVFECTQKDYEDWCDIKICPNAKEERSYNQALSDLATKIRERYIDKSL